MESRYDQLEEQARKFMAENPNVWHLFLRFTFDRIKAGHKHYSARGIFHRIRWETESPVQKEGEFKLNDHLSPFYARRFMDECPDHDGFFRTRRQISEDESATSLPELKPDYFDNR